MAHLYKFRKGWQSEHLAKFILSKFCFLAHPSNISDDIGSDFFCTLFKIEKEASESYLIPHNSFAIQIKSNKSNFEISNKMDYLSRLEIPFFVGVINKNESTLTIYSGEYLDHFIAYKAIKDKVWIELRDDFKFGKDWYRHDGEKTFLIFPKLIEIKSDFDYEGTTSIFEAMSKICSLIHSNISSRKNNEFVFKTRHIPEGFNSRWSIYSGKGSAQHYQENLYKRLIELFANLSWIFDKDNQNFNKSEFRIYEEFYNKVKEAKLSIPPYMIDILDAFVSDLKKRVDK